MIRRLNVLLDTAKHQVFTRASLAEPERIPAQKVVIFNLDGIIREKAAREAKWLDIKVKNFRAFYDHAVKEQPIAETVSEVKKVFYDHYKMVLMTGFPDQRLTETLRWLDEHELLHYFSDVYMKNGAMAKTANAVFKTAVVRDLMFRGFGDIACAYEDNPKVAEAFKKAGFGFPVFNLNDIKEDWK